MRLTRTSLKIRRRKNKATYLFIFLFLIPLFSILTSFIIFDILYPESDIKSPLRLMNIYDIKNTTKTFKYNLEMNGIKIYRIELNHFENFDNAKQYVEKLKQRKLNALILKEEGYIVVFGVFNDINMANDIIKKLEKNEQKPVLREIYIQSIKLNYDEYDCVYFMKVKDIDNLINEILVDKVDLSYNLLNDTQYDYNEIQKKEERLNQLIKEIKSIKTSEKMKAFSEDMNQLLSDIQKNILDRYDLSYYKVQINLIHQYQIYERFVHKLLI